MDIQYYLNDTEVRQVLFKQFSSRSHIWVKLIEDHKSALDRENGTLQLKYNPSDNQVSAIYDYSSSLLQMLHEEATNGSSRFLRYADSQVEMSY